MARTNTKKATTTVEKENKNILSEEKNQSSVSPNLGDILAIMQQMQEKIETLEKEKLEREKETKEEISSNLEDVPDYVKQMIEKINVLEGALAETNKTTTVSSNNTTEKLLEAFINSKSNREVTIIHNEEMFNGLCTAIELSNLHIEFTRLGEQRVLSWQQFEEMVSKYRGFINRGLIKVSIKDKDLCDKYQIQCYEPSEKYTLTSELLNKLPDMSDHELESVYNSLSLENQKILLNYWLGKCYAREEDRDERFYNRYKIDILNRLSNSYLFDNIIADMNNTYARKAGINK